MEMSQGNSLVASFITNKQKCHFFSFFFYKIRELEDRTGPAWGTDITRRGEVAGKGDRRVSTVQKMCTHICKCKNVIC
jgi:hypothetical protein